MMDDEVRILPRGYLLLSRLGFKYRYVFSKMVANGYWPKQLDSDRFPLEASDYYEPFAGALTLCFARDLCDLEISVLCKLPNVVDGRPHRSEFLQIACDEYSRLVCPSGQRPTCLALRVLRSFRSFWKATGGFAECNVIADALEIELRADVNSMMKGIDPRLSARRRSLRNDLLDELCRTLPSDR